MGLLRTLLIIIVVYYAFKLIGRFVFPLFLKRMMGKVEKQFREQQGQHTAPSTSVKEGETVIDKAPKTAARAKNEVGEYIDFEEVE